MIDGHVSVFFVVDNKEYEVEQFRIGFTQDVDYKGEPQHEVLGGRLLITLNEALPESFYSWGIDNNKFKNGEVYFTTGSGRLLNIEFINAKCINISRAITAGKGLQSVIILSPEIVKVNGIEHNNFWTK